jgi:uncharacterized protein affecting Mg2+/Co2+ transport
LTQHLAITETSSSQRNQELLGLKIHIYDLEQSEMQLLKRAKTITSCHQQNDLIKQV